MLPIQYSPPPQHEISYRISMAKKDATQAVFFGCFPSFILYIMHKLLIPFIFIKKWAHRVFFIHNIKRKYKIKS